MSIASDIILFAKNRLRAPFGMGVAPTSSNVKLGALKRYRGHLNPVIMISLASKKNRLPVKIFHENRTKGPKISGKHATMMLQSVNGQIESRKRTPLKAKPSGLKSTLCHRPYVPSDASHFFIHAPFLAKIGS